MTNESLTLHWAPVVATGWIVLLTLGAVLALAAGLIILRRKGLPAPWFAGLAALRILIIALFAACLAGPVLTFHRRARERPALLVLADQTLAGERRIEPLRWLRDGGLLAAARDDYALHGFGIHRDADAADLDTLADQPEHPGPARYARALQTAWNQVRFQYVSQGFERLPPMRALLVGDGNEAGYDDIATVARGLGVAVDTLAPRDPRASAAAETGIHIAAVYAPARVRLGAEARFNAVLSRDAAGEPDRDPASMTPVTVILEEDGEAVLQREIVFSDASDQRVTLAWRPTRPGLREYTLRLRDAADQDAVDVAGQDDVPAPFRFHLDVATRRHEVLLLEDTWRWEFKFLRRLLEDDPLFSFSAFLARGAGSFIQFSDPNRRIELSGYPRTRAELEGFDLFILGNVEPRRWPRALAPALRDLVVEQGKSLIVLAGPELGQIATIPELTDLLPVEISRDSATPHPGPVAVSVSADGRAAPFFFSAEPRLFRDDLPALDRLYAPLRKKPAATILVVADDLSNAYGKLIVMAEHTVGRGRVLYVGTDTLWKWQMRGELTDDGNSPYDVFWGQALRAMAPGRGVPGVVSLSLRGDPARARPGGRVVLSAGIDAETPLTAARVEGEIVGPDDSRQPVLFVADPDRPDRFQADYVPARTGRHRVHATLLSENAVVTEAQAAFDVAAAASAVEAPIQVANLRRIAAQTGGRFIDRDDPQTWPTAVTPEIVSLTRQRRLDLWRHFVLPGLLILTLGLDWLLRLVKGYV